MGEPTWSEGSGCSLLRSDWHCSLWPERWKNSKTWNKPALFLELASNQCCKWTAGGLTDREASLSSLYLAAIPKRVLLTARGPGQSDRPSPARRSPFGRWSRQTRSRHYWERINRSSEMVMHRIRGWITKRAPVQEPLISRSPWSAGAPDLQEPLISRCPWSPGAPDLQEPLISRSPWSPGAPDLQEPLISRSPWSPGAPDLQGRGLGHLGQHHFIHLNTLEIYNNEVEYLIHPKETVSKSSFKTLLVRYFIVWSNYHKALLFHHGRTEWFSS